MAAESGGFGEFIIESILGEGGMGKVYRARQISLDRWVALKVLPRAKENQSFIERFYREARSAARLVHPNIIQIHTVGEHQGIPYFAMEYIEGEDLENLIRAGNEPLSLDEIIDIIRSVAKALSVAMEHGIVHRDIKPANIMITRTGLVKVMDFGLAKGVTNDAVTQAGLVVGTPAYMSPEQGASKPVDTRSDIYSLGCVLYNCVCGRAPFSAENVASLLYKHMYEAPDPISQIAPAMNPEVEKVCLKMMAKKGEDRYQTPQELLVALAIIPSNSGAAEIALAKRANAAYSARRATAKNTPPTGIFPKPPSGMAQYIPRPPSHIGAVPEPTSSGKLPPPIDIGSSTRNTIIRQHVTTESRIAPPPPPPPPPSAEAPSGKIMVPRPPSSADSGSKLVPRKDSGIRRPASKIGDSFVKLPDGRWSYNVELGRCSSAFGLAAELTLKPGDKPQGLGDCLLCGNWNKRLGCAVATCRELENNKRYSGLKLLVEQAIVWTGAGRFDMGLGILDDFVKLNPEEPEAYRELARIYERPDYFGKDKRRAIVLYRRFLDLACGAGTYSVMDLTRAEERIAVLMAAPPETKSSILAPGAGVASQCFYRSRITCFSYAVLTADRLIVMRAGEVDPETGIHSSEMAGAMGKATTIFRRLKSEQAKKDEQAVVKKELQRLSDLLLEDLPKDAACVANVPLDQLTDVSMSVDTAVNIRCITMKTPQQTHQLLFTESAVFKAEQSHELIKRKLKMAAPA